MNNIPRDNEDGIIHIGLAAHEYIQELRDHQENPEKYRPIKTGLIDLDAIIGGVTHPMYIGIGGRAKKGKSTVAQHLATVLSLYEQNVAYFLIEEQVKQMAARALARQSPLVSRTVMRNLEITPEGFNQLEGAARMLDKTALYLSDRWDNADLIIGTCRKYGIEVAVVDYMQLLLDAAGKSEQERLANISRKFIRARNVDNITFIVVYQLNDKKTASAFGSNAVYRDADLIIEVSQLEDGNKSPIEGKLNMTVRESRMCPSGGVATLNFSGAHSMLSNIATFDTVSFVTESDENEQDNFFNPFEGEPED